MKKKVQKGWKFKGVDVYSTNYTKIHYFPAGLDTSKERYYDDREQNPDYTIEVSGSLWNYYEDRPLPANFEVTIIERFKGKIVSTEFAKGSPLFEEVEIPDDEPALEEGA